jgi:transcriptional regulator with XRE-family HTH domain
MNPRVEIKKILLEKNMTLSEIAQKLGIILNKEYSLNNLSSKLRKETIPFKEIDLIADILGYEIIFKEKS